MSIKHKYYRLEVASYQDIDTKAINEKLKKNLGNVQSIIWNLTEEETEDKKQETISDTSKYYKDLHVPVTPEKELKWMLTNRSCDISTVPCRGMLCTECIYSRENSNLRQQFYKETFEEKPEKIEADTETKTEDSVFVIRYPKTDTIEMFKSWDGLEKRVRTHLMVRGVMISSVVDSTTNNTIKILKSSEFLDYSSVCKSLNRLAGVRVYYEKFSDGAHDRKDYISIYKMPLKA